MVVARTYISSISMQQKGSGMHLDSGCNQTETKTIRQKAGVLHLPYLGKFCPKIHLRGYTHNNHEQKHNIHLKKKGLASTLCRCPHPRVPKRQCTHK